MPIRKLHRKVNQILLITIQKKDQWYVSNRSKIWKLLKPTTKIVHNDITHISHTDEYYINLLEWDVMQSGKYVPVLLYCNRGQQHLLVWWLMNPLTSGLLVCQWLQKRQSQTLPKDWLGQNWIFEKYICGILDQHSARGVQMCHGKTVFCV